MSFIEFKVWVFFLIILTFLKVVSILDRRINYPNWNKAYYHEHLGIGPWYSSLLFLMQWAVGVRLFIAFTVWFFKTF